ncbi:MAG TPA: hypothetical protein DCS07_12140 [Bdellovibrionales bacterium]|nr:MAG: hypothetical protein A2Z97_02080 [Bdellovibrionales bacterium GWB1_52_6]OFZ03767.1 MAG: hypothetical protein A2X97_14540 [Bdellovibrionales bacterium GWA1_52_35]OFZ41787.1 MAG: hypothetical protein A2070_09315 [Bdellovibrionales bacterium GWC1_52_8]HAR43359.1 hypothetical protein [Bdellovibrionales bacterium]HCM38716.1 hypothetical protein [Bdellovibrionales bacterium]
MQEPSINIYDFNSYRDFVAAAAKRYEGRKNRPFSLMTWSKRLGYRSPRSIAMVIKGQRFPSQEMIRALARDLKLTEREERYGDLLVQLEKAHKRNRDPRPILEALQRLQPKANAPSIDVQTFAYISSWYFLVIKQLVETPNFKESPAWIRRKLLNKVTEAEVRQAIQTMLNLGILKRDPDKRLRIQKAVVSSTDIPSSAIRLHHQQMLERAKEALEQQEVLTREFGSLVFKMAPSRIHEAKERVRAFRDAFEQEFGASGSGEVYQFNFQIFSHTDRGEA